MASPQTLSRQQFMQTAAAKNPGASYAKYLGYLAKRRGAMLGQQNADPFAPTDVNAEVRRLVGTMPTAQTPAQLQAGAQGMLDPVVKRITDAINAQARSGQNAVTGITNAYAGNLAQTGQQNVRNAFAPAEAGQAAASAALADRVSGTGNQTADDLAARLGAINAPDAVDPAVAALRQNAAGVGNAAYASGDASLQQMLAQHGDAAAYADKLPGIARLTGIQQSGQVAGQATKNLADQLGPVYAQVPSLVQGLRNADTSKLNDWNSRRDSLYGALTTAQQRDAALAEKKGEFKVTSGMKQKAADFLDWYRTEGVHLSQAKIEQKAAEFGVSSSIQQQNASTSAGRASETARHNAVTEAQGAARLKAAQVKNAKGAKRGGLTPKQVLDLRGKAETLADQAFNGAPATAKLAKLDPLDYQAAIEEAKKEGIPAAIYLPAFNARYLPGTRGRPNTKATAATAKFFKSTGRGFGG